MNQIVGLFVAVALIHYLPPWLTAAVALFILFYWGLSKLWERWKLRRALRVARKLLEPNRDVINLNDRRRKP